MRLLSLLLIACSGKSPPPSTDIALENLISTRAVGVTREQPDAFAILGAVRELVDNQPCWTLLKQQLVAGYQVSLDHGSYFIAEGNVPRADLEKCLPVTFKLDIKIRADGDLVAFETPGGTVHAAWRGKFIVFGSQLDVSEALTTPTADTVARWRRLFAPLSTAVSYVLRVDATIAPMIGEGSTDYAFVIDKVTTTPAFFGGRFVVHYATPDAATKGAQHIKAWSSRGKFPLQLAAPDKIVALYDRLAVAIGRMRLSQNGADLEIAFDTDQLGGVEVLESVLGSLDSVKGALTPK